MRMRKLFLLVPLVIGLVGCSAANENTSRAVGNNQVNLTMPKTDYSKKIEIIQHIKTPESTLSILIPKLETEWPSLFTVKNEDELFDRYSFITWHIDEEAQKRLRDNLTKLHPEFQEYVKLLKEGVLPAKECKVTNIAVDKYNADSVSVTAEYDFLLQDGSNKKIKISLTADSNFEKFNQRFNTAEGVPLPSADKDEELKRDFIFSILSNDEIRKLTADELFTLFE
ncbi:hypothetical protein [Brevibacillus nitrificans]|uniref:hypothetical protein n=1 Tax=Brevibacillus nitrificans TaxID=651560 RepID=UPI002865B9B5|nr:hypothetical protein [Brevibacillus nitrificans]MDR7317016.1 hypothetical protein [Brevibacillus nitrificans]